MSDCGSYAGYQAHRRRGTAPCDECRKANNLYMAERRDDPWYARRERRRQAARERALSRLMRMHPTEYAALYDEELAKEGM